MECKIGKYLIRSDPKNYTIYENKHFKAGMAPGGKLLPERDVETICGNYSSFESALKAIPSHALRRSDASNLAEAIAVVQSYHDFIKDLAQGA